MSTAKYAMSDTKKPDGLYIRFMRVDIIDDHFEPRDYLFQDPAYKAEDQKRLNAFLKDEWYGLGIRAVAVISHVSNGAAFHFEIASAGIWGIESDSGDEYLEEVYQDQIASLKATIAAMSTPVYEQAVYNAKS